MLRACAALTLALTDMGGLVAQVLTRKIEVAMVNVVGSLPTTKTARWWLVVAPSANHPEPFEGADMFQRSAKIVLPTLLESDSPAGPWTAIPDEEIPVTMNLAMLKQMLSEEAWIPVQVVIDLSNGLLTRKRLEKAIQAGEVRDRKPSAKRRELHIRDVVALFVRLTSKAGVSEEATAMFSRLLAAQEKKQGQR